ncbi:hypothetical protein OH77DRAFT_1456391 [Trametes cingulata]|nr:hypothetical protein OH77DRAFT_1456391 [Trametes cingulata]
MPPANPAAPNARRYRRIAPVLATSPPSPVLLGSSNARQLRARPPTGSLATSAGLLGYLSSVFCCSARAALHPCTTPLPLPHLPFFLSWVCSGDFDVCGILGFVRRRAPLCLRTMRPSEARRDRSEGRSSYGPLATCRKYLSSAGLHSCSRDHLLYAGWEAARSPRRQSVATSSGAQNIAGSLEVTAAYPSLPSLAASIRAMRHALLRSRLLRFIPRISRGRTQSRWIDSRPNWHSGFSHSPLAVGAVSAMFILLSAAWAILLSLLSACNGYWAVPARTCRHGGSPELVGCRLSCLVLLGAVLLLRLPGHLNIAVTAT